MKARNGFILVALLYLTACAPTTTQQMDAYGTSVVAQGQMQVSGMMLTGTAQAPIIHMTETRAAFDMEQVYAAATDVSAVKTSTAAVAQTQASWTPTPIPTATPNATSTVVAANVIAIQTTVQLETERKETSNNFWSVILPLFMVALLASFVFAMIQVARYFRKRERPRDAQGAAIPLEDTVSGEIIDIDVNPNYSTGKDDGLVMQAIEQWLIRKYGFVPKHPQITAERQDMVKDRAQRIRLASLPKRLVDTQSTAKYLQVPASAASLPASSQLFPLPDWSIMDGWDSKIGGSLPYGLSARGIEFMDLNQSPHNATIGKTGSGKSRRFLRPFLAGALATGQRVVIIGKQADYWPFTMHANATILPVSELTMIEEAKKYAYFLKKIVEEMNRRDAELVSMRKSTWQQAGRENTLIVLDELGNAIDLMPAEFANESYRYVRGLVKEGRKVGLNIIFSSQRAKGFRDVMTQVGRAVFFVEDEQESRHALGMLGAETLQEGYFFAKFSGMKLTGSFEPSDDDLVSFLMSRQVPALPQQDWIEGEIKPLDMKMIEPAKNELHAAAGASKDEEIMRRYSEKQSLAKIQREVFGDETTGGANFNRIKAVIARNSATTTTNSLIIPNLGAVAQ